jgi:alpha-tubulin suppressor-like RCC1 family protein
MSGLARSGSVGGVGGVLASGDFHSLAAKSDGTVWAWGANYSGQLDNGTLADSHTLWGSKISSRLRVAKPRGGIR